MNPKAILKFPKRSRNTKGGGKVTKTSEKKKGVSNEKDAKYPSTLERLTYCLLVKKVIPESEVQRNIPDRVLWIEGDLGDWGYPVRDAKLMAQALDFGHETKRGRQSRGLILSCPKVLPADEHLRAGVFKKLRASLSLLAKRLGITCWIAIAHDDRHHPHVHFIFRNWNEKKRRRLDIRPTHLKDLQSMDWTEHLESGRGSREGTKETPDSARGKAIQNYVKGEEPKQKALAARKEAPIQALQKFLNDQKVARMETPHQLAQFLYDHPSLPTDWDRSKLLTRKGEPRKDPAIIIAGEGLKFSRFFKFVSREVERRKKAFRSGPGGTRSIVSGPDLLADGTEMPR